MSLWRLLATGFDGLAQPRRSTTWMFMPTTAASKRLAFPGATSRGATARRCTQLGVLHWGRSSGRQSAGSPGTDDSALTGRPGKRHPPQKKKGGRADARLRSALAVCKGDRTPTFTSRATKAYLLAITLRGPSAKTQTRPQLSSARLAANVQARAPTFGVTPR
jgi:hypothetical protein